MPLELIIEISIDFSSLSLYNTLTQQVFLLPMALASGADAFMGISRVGEFMSQGEIREGEKFY